MENFSSSPPSSLSSSPSSSPLNVHDQPTHLIKILIQDLSLLENVLSQPMGEHGLAFGIDLCKGFLNFENGTYCSSLLKLSLKIEFSRVQNAPHAVYTLFRSNNTPVAAVRHFLCVFGDSYLNNLGAFMKATINNNSKTANPMGWAQSLIDYVLLSLEQVPLAIRILFGMISQELDSFGLKEHRNVVFGALLFFRFIIPFLICSNNDASSFIIDVNSEHSKALIEMAKILTSLVNYSLGSNEILNDFIQHNTLPLGQFYDRLSVLDASLGPFSQVSLNLSNNPGKQLTTYFVSALESFLQENEGQDSEKEEYFLSLVHQFKPLTPLIPAEIIPRRKRKSSLSIVKDKIKSVTLRRIRSENP